MVGQRPARPKHCPLQGARHHEAEITKMNRSRRFDSKLSLDVEGRTGDSSTHAGSTLSTLFRTHGCDAKHGTLLCVVDRADALRHTLPDAAVGTYRLRRTGEGASFRVRGRRSRDVPRSAPGKARARIPNAAGGESQGRGLIERMWPGKRSFGPPRRSIRRDGPEWQGKSPP